MSGGNKRRSYRQTQQRGTGRAAAFMENLAAQEGTRETEAETEDEIQQYDLESELAPITKIEKKLNSQYIQLYTLAERMSKLENQRGSFYQDIDALLEALMDLDDKREEAHKKVNELMDPNLNINIDEAKEQIQNLREKYEALEAEMEKIKQRLESLDENIEATGANPNLKSPVIEIRPSSEPVITTTAAENPINQDARNSVENSLEGLEGDALKQKFETLREKYLQLFQRLSKISSALNEAGHSAPLTPEMTQLKETVARGMEIAQERNGIFETIQRLKNATGKKIGKGGISEDRAREMITDIGNWCQDTEKHLTNFHDTIESLQIGTRTEPEAISNTAELPQLQEEISSMKKEIPALLAKAPDSEEQRRLFGLFLNNISRYEDNSNDPQIIRETHRNLSEKILQPLRELVGETENGPASNHPSEGSPTTEDNPSETAPEVAVPYNLTEGQVVYIPNIDTSFTILEVDRANNRFKIEIQDSDGIADQLISFNEFVGIIKEHGEENCFPFVNRESLEIYRSAQSQSETETPPEEMTGDELDYTFSRSFRYIINEAKLSSIIFAERNMNGKEANDEAERQLQYLDREKIEANLGTEIVEIIATGISSGKLDSSKIDMISQETGLSEKDIMELLNSTQQEIRSMAVTEAHKGRNWKKILGSSAARILAYSGAGAISAAAGFGWGGAAGIAGVRVLDRTITELLDKKKIKAKEKELRQSLQEDEQGKKYLYDNFVSGLIRKQNERINGNKYSYNYDFFRRELVGKYSENEEQGESLIRSLDALEEIDRVNKEWADKHQDGAVNRTIKYVGESRVGKALDVLSGGGKSTSEKVVATTMLGAIGLVGRQAPGVRNVLIAMAGWRLGDFAVKTMEQRLNKKEQEITERDDRNQEQLDQIKSSQDILQRVSEGSSYRAARYSGRKEKLMAKAAIAGIFFAGSFIIPELLGYGEAHAQGSGHSITETTHSTSPDSNNPPDHVAAPATKHTIPESSGNKANQGLLDKLDKTPGVKAGPAPMGASGEHDPDDMSTSATEGENPDVTEPDENPDIPVTTTTHHHTASTLPSRDHVANNGDHSTHSTAHSATETKAPNLTPELKRQIELGTVHKGGGVWHSIHNQFKDLETAKKFGFNPDKDGDLNHWAEIKTNETLHNTGYIGENGQEVRVGTSGIGKTSYVLETDGKGNISVREYFDGKPIEIHGPHSEFETKIESYEYGYGKGAVEHHSESATTTEASSSDQASSSHVESLSKLSTPLSAEEISKLEVSANMHLDGYTLYPIEHISDPKLEALNQELGGGFKLFEVDTNGDGQVDHVFTFFENKIINQDALDHQAVETSLRINELRLDNQIESSLQRLCEDTLSKEQLISLIKAGNEAGITGFSPLEGAIPGSSFDQFLHYFKGHSNLFITEENKISTDQMKIFNSLNGQVIDPAKFENILSRTHDLPWNLDRKMAIAEAMNTPNNPEIMVKLLDKNVASPLAKLSWSNAHTLKFEGLVSGNGRMNIDFNDTQRGISIPEGFMNMGRKHFALSELEEAMNYLKIQQGLLGK